METIVNFFLNSLKTAEALNPINLLFLCLISGFILLLFAFGSMIFVKTRKELKALNGNDRQFLELSQKIDKLFSLLSDTRQEVKFLEGKVDTIIQSSKKPEQL